MKLRILAWTAVSALAALSLSNCILSVKEEQATQGRELSDLKQALQSGAITPVEYKTKKAEIMKTPG